MSVQLSILNYQNHSIHSLIKNGEIFFRATQLAELLEYQNPHDAIKKHVDTDDLAKCEVIDSIGRKQKVNFVNESGMYSLILGSKQESAKKIKKLVTSEVLPTIRKTGSYSLTINTEQQQAIKQAVNERAFRTGENHKSIYIKLHKEFKIPRYAELPASKFDDAIKFLGRVHVRNGLSDDDWYEIAWLYKVSYKMINEIIDIEPALRAIKSTKATTFWSLGHDNKPALFNAKRIIERETAHISDIGLNNKWNHVLPFIRHKPKGIINFEADIAYLD